MVLIDTDIFVDLFRNFLPAKRFFKTISSVSYSAITETELLVGEQNNDPETRNQVLAFLSGGGKISMGNPIARLAGDLRRKYGLTVPDAMIAATALITKQELVSRNRKDFIKVPDLKLRVPY